VWIHPKEFQIELIRAETGGFPWDGSGTFKINKVKHPQSYKDLENWVQETIVSNK
jgi:hypothetical protein